VTAMQAGRVILAAVLLTLLAGACSREITGVAVEKQFTEGTDEACNVVSAPMTPIPAEDYEPRMLVPQPPNWRRDLSLDTERVRFAMANASVWAGHLAVAAIAIKSKDGQHDPATVFDELRSEAEQDPEATDLAFTDTTVCGYPATRVDYTRLATDELPVRAETMLAVVAQTTGKTHAVVVTVSTNDAGSPAYQRDVETILTGFQVLATTA
jgi:hypothetical protein